MSGKGKDTDMGGGASPMKEGAEDGNQGGDDNSRSGPNDGGGNDGGGSSGGGGTKGGSSGSSSGGNGGESKSNEEMYVYRAPWTIYGMDWFHRPDSKFRLAISSFLEDYRNKVRIVELAEDKKQMVKVTEFDHPYPATKLMCIPDTEGKYENLLATSGDYLRIWKVGKNGNVSLRSLLNTNKDSEFCAPLTSFDWCDKEKNIIGTASIDLTCTIWDVETCQAKTQLIAHDKEVYDFSFAPVRNFFASCGADGSVRMFDIRNLRHSTILYESERFAPLLRVAWNKRNFHYIATIQADSGAVTVIDIRSPSKPVALLRGHRAPVNSMAWSPQSERYLCSAGEDSQALIWDFDGSNRTPDPYLAYKAGGEVNSLQWYRQDPTWISLCYADRLEVLRI